LLSSRRGGQVHPAAQAMRARVGLVIPLIRIPASMIHRIMIITRVTPTAAARITEDSAAAVMWVANIIEILDDNEIIFLAALKFSHGFER